jgi:hypothetical protein
MPRTFLDKMRVLKPDPGTGNPDPETFKAFGAQAGDPVKAAAVIIHIASLDEPPLRLLLGSDAVHSAEQSDIARVEADRKWRDLSVSTDFEAGGGSKVYPWERK